MKRVIIALFFLMAITTLFYPESANTEPCNFDHFWIFHSDTTITIWNLKTDPQHNLDDLIQFDANSCAGGYLTYYSREPRSYPSCQFWSTHWILKLRFDDFCNKPLCWTFPYGNVKCQLPMWTAITDIDILDYCFTPLNERGGSGNYKVCPEEYIVFYCDLIKSNAAFQVPSTIEGSVRTRDGTYTVALHKDLGHVGSHIKYYSDAIAAGSFFTGDNYGNLIYRIEHEDDRPLQMNINVCRSGFVIDELNFVDDIKIYTGAGNIEACFPFEAYLNFGTTVDVGNHWWPVTDCQSFIASISCYDSYNNDEFILITAGIVQQNEFETMPPGISSYQIPDYVGHDDLRLKWKVMINYNEDFTIKPQHTNLRVWYGFDAKGIIINSPPQNMAIDVDEPLENLTVDTQPFLLSQERIEYFWEMREPDGAPSGSGQYLIPNPLDRNQPNTFTASYPGDYELYYRIKDNVSNTESESPHTIVHVKPQLVIAFPEENRQICYNTDAVGLLDNIGLANVVPQDLEDDIQWRFEYLTDVSWGCPLEPNDCHGSEITFRYTKLPADNDEFGATKIYAELPEYNVTTERQIYIFFNKDATNHQGGQQEPKSRNWFHYWVNGRVACDPNYDLINVFYNPGLFSAGRYYSEQNMICLGKSAAWAHDTIKISTLPQILFLPRNGIDLSAETLKHENFHRTIYNNWRPPSGEWYLLYGDHPFYMPGVTNPADPDGDGILTTDELFYSLQFGIALDSNKSDTYELHANGYAPHEETGDQELIARLIARDAVGDSTRDWSKGEYSRQWGH
ncbi:MAG: hypothetical protein GY855_12100 [candidate division Zixibacteria bacterium]|nr:hypothetical protein [candidate division Zixibacteria bacterium]